MLLRKQTPLQNPVVWQTCRCPAQSLVKDGVDARVIMPLYGDLKFRDKLEYVTNYSVPVGWRSSTAACSRPKWTA